MSVWSGPYDRTVALARMDEARNAVAESDLTTMTDEEVIAWLCSDD